MLSLCIILNFTAVHLVYWSNMRMRAPLVPLIALIAARGLSTFFDRRKVNKFVPATDPLPLHNMSQDRDLKNRSQAKVCARTAY